MVMRSYFDRSLETWSLMFLVLLYCSIALHPTGNYVASGQATGQAPDALAHIRVWDIHSLTTHSIIGAGVFQNGVSSMSFSNMHNGEFLLAVDTGDQHIMSVWDWRADRQLAKTPTHPETVVGAAFYPEDNTIVISYGKQHLFFWKFQGNKILRDKKSGLFGADAPRYLTALEFARNGDVITGDSNGTILVWSRDDNDMFRINEDCSVMHAHDKSVFALKLLDDGTLLISGGGNTQDRMIKAWDVTNNYALVKEKQLPEAAGGIRAICPQKPKANDGNFYVATTKNCIMEGSLNRKFKYIVQSHTEELWALAVHPKAMLYATAGYDKYVCMWTTHKLLWRTNVDKECVSSCFHPDGDILAVGTTDGRIIILNVGNGSHMASVQSASAQLEVLKFSPDGSKLAVGCYDGNIYMYDVLDEGQYLRKHKTGVLRGHTNYVMCVDWSVDSYYLQSVSGDYDLLFWDIRQMEQETLPAAMRDTDWETFTCIVGYPVSGMWGERENLSIDLNSCDRSPDKTLLAVGDNQGGIRLYRYPAINRKAGYSEQQVYSGNVTNVEFLPDNSGLLSTGGTDAALMFWSLVPAKSS